MRSGLRCWPTDPGAGIFGPRHVRNPEKFTGTDDRRTSARRFATLNAARDHHPFDSDADIFRALNPARITSLTKWQIVWRQDERRVTWRYFTGHDPSAAFHIDFRDIDFRCAEQGLRVTNTPPVDGVRFAACGPSCIAATAARIDRIFSLLGVTVRGSQGEPSPLRFVKRTVPSLLRSKIPPADPTKTAVSATASKT